MFFTFILTIPDLGGVRVLEERDYHISEKVIGSGAFGTVFMGTYFGPAAVKVLALPKTPIDLVKSEVEVLR